MTNTAPQDQPGLLLDVARRALVHYAIGDAVILRLVNLSENAIYEVAGNQGRYALRIHRRGYHAPAAIASELAWAMALRDAGVAATPRPIRTRDGGYIAQIDHPSLPRSWSAVLFHWESGAEPHIADDLTAPFERLGAVTARMHSHARSWQKPTGFTRPVWNLATALGETNPHWGRWRDGMGTTPEIIAIFARTVSAIGHRLEAFGSGPDRFGLCHCDLRLANLLIDGSAVKVIDFDDCGFSWFMYDAATPVSFYEDDPKVPDLIAAWCKGYRGEAALSAEEEAEIPTFVMLRRLLLVAWIGSHSETDLARSLGIAYTQRTTGLCEVYLSRFS